jgi:pSer/pThr/pTyr-binding forkhead associated (FHA) protein
MTARLSCKTGQLSGAEYSIGKEATIGTATGNTIQLYPTVISGRHARIFLDEKSGKYMIEDFNSSNGTRVDGMPVRGMMRLEHVNVITFAGSFDFVFQIIDAPSKKAKSSSETPPSNGGKTMFDNGAIVTPVIGGGAARTPQKPASPIKEQPAALSGKETMLDDAAMPPPRKEETIVGMNFEATPGFSPEKQSTGQETVFDSGYVSSPEIGSSIPTGQYFLRFIVAGEAKEILLNEGENFVGREEGCAVRLSDSSISRQHACLTVKQGRVSVRDLGSKNHTFVESEQITQETEVAGGQSLVFGMVKTELIQRAL